MSNSTSADTFVSQHSGMTFPASEAIPVVGFGRISKSEFAENSHCYVEVADTPGAIYHVDSTHPGIDDGGAPCWVTPGCAWGRDPNGKYVHPDVSTEVYTLTPGYRHRRTRTTAWEGDPNIYTDTWDNRLYWAPHFPFRSTPGYERVSEYNIHHNFSECVDCGELFPHVELDSNGRCPSCAETAGDDDDDDDDDDDFENLRDADGRISSYGNREYPPPRGKGPVLLGVELEVELARDVTDDRSRLAQFVAGACRDRDGRFVIIKEDGSLSHGFEIVSAPMDLNAHKTVWNTFFDRLESKQIRGLKAWTTTTAGMHVHVSREPLSCLQVGKIVVFVNTPQNKAFMTAVAGRDSNHYTKFVAATKLVTGHRGYGGDRYCSVNLCNAKTIEFRVFKATLNRARFQANIQFCAALVQYCAPCERSLKESSSHTAFASWVRHHRKRYQALDDLLVRKGFLPPVKTGKGAVAELVTVDSD